MVAAALSLDVPLKGRALWVTGITLAVANFLVVLDTTIANVSIPNIAGGLSVSATQGSWVITSYAVADAITVPLTGWLSVRYGQVRVFCTAILLFAFWSFVCGLSHSLGMLVVGRVMQGLSGGPMIPLSQGLLMRVFGKERSGAASGLWAVTTLVAPVLGPILGGELCDQLSWPWIFYVNVPIAIACSLLTWRLLGKRDDKPVRVPVDYVGLGLLVLWVGALQIMLDKGRELDWFSSPFIVMLAAVSIIGLISFLIWELTADNPVVDLSVFRSRSFSLCAIVVTIGYSSFFAGWVIIPLWLQVNMGYTATLAGRSSGLNGIFAILMAPIVARLLGFIDSRALVSFGLILSALLMLWRTQYNSDISFWDVGIPNLLQGITMPLFFIPLVRLYLADFEGKSITAAAGLFSFVRTTSGAFGVSLALTAWDNSTNVARNDIVGSMSNGNQALQTLQERGFSLAQAQQQLDFSVSGQAVMLATNHLFYILAATLTLSAALVWFVPRLKGPLKSGGH